MTRLFQTSLRLLVFIGALAIVPRPTAAEDYKPVVGLQSYTCRNMNFDQMVEFAVKHKLKYIQVIGNHINPEGPMEETKRKKAILDEKGLVCYTFGVTGTYMEPEKNRRLFEFAKLMGCKIIVVEPRDFRILDNLEALAKEYDIKVAIHNHGITSLYGNPLVVKTLIGHRDPRVGVCLDVGHVTGSGFDAAKIFKDYNGRVFDIHLKDKKVERSEGGKEVILDVEIGTGQSNFKGLFQELKKANWQGVMAIETDNATYAKSPEPYVQAAIAYVEQHKP
jgi:sugar phosphate isomerase/epimerase